MFPGKDGGEWECGCLMPDWDREILWGVGGWEVEGEGHERGEMQFEGMSVCDIHMIQLGSEQFI